MDLKALMTMVLIAVPAAAAEKERDFTHSGPYVQAAAMKTINSFEPSGTAPTGWGFSAGAGYRFSSWYAVQVDYQRGEMEDSDRFVGGGADVSGNIETTNWSVMGSGKLYPLASSGIRFQPYALVGMGILGAKVSTRLQVSLCSPVCVPSSDTTTNTSDAGFAIKYGGGADIHITERIYGFVDYAFYHSIQAAIEGFDFHAIGGGVGVRW